MTHKFKVLSLTFEEHDVVIDYDLNPVNDIHLGAKQLKYLFLTLCEYFIYAKHEVAPSKKVHLHVKSLDSNKGKISVSFCLEGIDSLPPLHANSPSLEAIHNRFNQLLGLKIDSEVSKESLCVRVEFV